MKKITNKTRDFIGTAALAFGVLGLIAGIILINTIPKPSSQHRFLYICMYVAILLLPVVVMGVTLSKLKYKKERTIPEVYPINCCTFEQVIAEIEKSLSQKIHWVPQPPESLLEGKVFSYTCKNHIKITTLVMVYCDELTKGHLIAAKKYARNLSYKVFPPPGGKNVVHRDIMLCICAPRVNQLMKDFIEYPGLVGMHEFTLQVGVELVPQELFITNYSYGLVRSGYNAAKRRFLELVRGMLVQDPTN